MDGAVRDLVARHLPGVSIQSVRRLGEGWDNVAFLVNDDLIVRCSKAAGADDRAEAIRREVDLLEVAGEISPVPVPRIVFADPEAGTLAYRRIDGEPLLGLTLTDPVRLAPALGALLSSLHGVDTGSIRQRVPSDLFPHEAYLESARDDYRHVVDHIPTRKRPSVEDFLGRAAPPDLDPGRAVFCHNDLGAEHILVADGSITGVIDWSDAAITDPARDVGVIYRDLGPDVVESMLAEYTAPWTDGDLERARFHARCTLLGDIAYGLRTGERQYSDEGLAHLDHTFA